jgi:starch synthase
METSRILFITQEITPFVPESEISKIGRTLPQATQERGREIRIFTPKWGFINERRNQLHEVIRLSGMNLIIDDTDHPLIIKVASLQAARMQVYFIDNDDYFHNRLMTADEQGNDYCDNDERAIFFARGVLETVKKLRWAPTVVHCHGWFAAVAPVYLKRVFSDDPIFRDVKVVVSLYGDEIPGKLDPEFDKKIASEGVTDKNLDILTEPSYENLCRFVLDYADGVVLGSDKISEEVLKLVRESGKPTLEYQSPEAPDFFDNYNRFYDEIQ